MTDEEINEILDELELAERITDKMLNRKSKCRSLLITSTGRQYSCWYAAAPGNKYCKLHDKKEKHVRFLEAIKDGFT